MKITPAETRAAEKIVAGAFAKLTGRAGEPLRYAIMTDTPVGPIGLAAGGSGLSRVVYTRDEDAFLARMLAEGDRPVMRSDALDRARKALDRYFNGRRLDFDDIDVDLSEVSGFARRVLEETARIPAGRFVTYGQIAAKAGNAKASRAAGNALHHNPVAIVVPCHRILRSDGSLGGYGGGVSNKEWLLRHEGALMI